MTSLDNTPCAAEFGGALLSLPFIGYHLYLYNFHPTARRKLRVLFINHISAAAAWIYAAHNVVYIANSATKLWVSPGPSPDSTSGTITCQISASIESLLDAGSHWYVAVALGLMALIQRERIRVRATAAAANIDVRRCMGHHLAAMAFSVVVLVVMWVDVLARNLDFCSPAARDRAICTGWMPLRVHNQSGLDDKLFLQIGLRYTPTVALLFVAFCTWFTLAPIIAGKEEWTEQQCKRNKNLIGIRIFGSVFIAITNTLEMVLFLYSYANPSVPVVLMTMSMFMRAISGGVYSLCLLASEDMLRRLPTSPSPAVVDEDGSVDDAVFVVFGDEQQQQQRDREPHGFTDAMSVLLQHVHSVSGCSQFSTSKRSVSCCAEDIDKSLASEEQIGGGSYSLRSAHAHSLLLSVSQPPSQYSALLVAGTPSSDHLSATDKQEGSRTRVQSNASFAATATPREHGCFA